MKFQTQSLPLFALIALMATSSVSCRSSKSPNPSLSKFNVLSFQEFALTQPTPAESSSPATAPSVQPTEEPNTSRSCDDLCQKRKLEFRYVAYVGKQIYCYWDLKKAETKTDFDQLAQTLESSISSGMSRTEYYLLLRKWASSFHDGHVNVMLKSDMSELEIFTSTVRVEVLAPATDHEKLIVSEVKEVPGISVGDEITAINEVPTKDAITRAAALYSSGSTERMRRYSASRRLVDVYGTENASKPFTLTLHPMSGGEEKTVQVFRNVEIDPKPMVVANTDDSGLSNITARILPNSIGYLRLDAFGGSQDDYLIGEAMDRLSATRGLIIDLRKNGGGDLSGDRIIERLIQQTVTRYKRSERLNDYILSQNQGVFGLTPDSTGLFALWHDLLVKPNPDHHYDKPVVALISPYCFSACDTFSAALQGNGLATFVGEPTGGGTGTPLVFDLPTSPFQFRYSVIRGETPSGDWIEGVGTSPDLYIEPTAEDRAKQRDSQLVKAIEVLELKISPSQPAPVSAGAISAQMLGAPAIWSQRLDLSPTRAENELLIQVSRKDER